ncbi:hypothetical protein [Brevundimonas sp.]|nr:hypothetical protein [Brevundimonas sp.]
MLQPKRQEQEQPVELDKTVDFDAIARKLLASKPRPAVEPAPRRKSV